MPPRNEFLDAAFPYPFVEEDDPVVETMLNKYFFGRTIFDPDQRMQHMMRTVDLFGHDNFTIEYTDNTETFIIHPI